MSKWVNELAHALKLLLSLFHYSSSLSYYNCSQPYLHIKITRELCQTILGPTPGQLTQDFWRWGTGSFFKILRQFEYTARVENHWLRFTHSLGPSLKSNFFRKLYLILCHMYLKFWFLTEKYISIFITFLMHSYWHFHFEASICGHLLMLCGLPWWFSW